ncbi:MAG TPA: hypothetical protein VKM72_29995 [Thermoanaerobaculia bacterium]|nr:hypothetical protein [Thermoanaerobaculia bacterium]
MNGVLPSLGGVALFLAAGLGLAELVPSVRTLPWPRRLAWAYLLGLAGLAGALYALSHFLDVPLRRPAILGTTAALVLCGLAAWGLRQRRGRGVRFPLSRRKGGRWERGLGGEVSWIEIGAAALLAFICLGLLADAVTDPVTGWDGRMTWSTQALWVLDEGTVDSEVLLRKNLYVTHPQYPLLMPIAQVVVLETFAVPQDVHAFRALYTTCFAAFLLLLWDGGRRWAGRLPTLLAGLAAAGVPALTFFEDSGAASGYSDLPLGCFYGAGLLLLLRGRRSVSDALGAGLLLAGAALTKNEGALLAFFALGIAAWFFLRKKFPPRRPKLHQLVHLAAATVPVLLALALLASWRAGIPNRQDERYDVLIGTEDFWPGVVTRMPGLAALALRQMLRFDHWTVFWIVIPVVFWVGRRGWSGRRKALALALAAGALAPLMIAWGAYSIHPHPDTLIPVTWTRFLVQGSLALFLLLALGLRDVLNRAAPLARVSQERSRT